ncbi:MAG TPA: sugar phosphate isomerase/epimerase family protein [Limnochordales bacterium]
MREPLSAYMKVGIVHFMAFPEAASGVGAIASTVERIATDPFFESIEVTWVQDPQERARVSRVIQQSRLAAGFGAQPVQLAGKLDINTSDAQARLDAVERLKGLIDMAAEMGIHRFALLSGRDPGEAGREEAVRHLIDSLHRLCEHAASHGTTVILETFDRTVDKKALVGPAREAAAIAEKVRERYPNFGLMLDLSHLPLQDERPLEALSAVREHVVHIHIGNCVKDPSSPLYGDLHPRFGVPGGEVDVPEVVEFLDALFKIGYLGDGRSERPIVAFEIKPHGDETSETVIANAKRTLVEAWSRL